MLSSEVMKQYIMNMEIALYEYKRALSLVNG
jgi:hypothetical protein